MAQEETKSMAKMGGSPPELDVFVFPMSFTQQRLWFLDQLEPGGTVYNTPFVVQLSGKLNIEALESSLGEIIRRHEVLRATFCMVKGAPAQVIHPPQAFVLPVVELAHLPDGQPMAQVRKLASQENSKPFNLSRDSIVRAQLLKVAEDNHVLLLTTHHIVFDAWSRAVLIRELAALYEAFSAGQPSPLPELPLQFTDFAVWQNQYLSGDTLEQQLEYWRKQLAGAPGSLEMPTDRPRPAVATFNGSSYIAHISTELTEQLKAFSREEGATLFMTLLAAYQTLLARYSGQDDVVVGTPIANRNRAELEGLIGFFANTLVLRSRFDKNPTFRELLRQVRETALGAYAHQDLPFEKLVEELKPERSLSHNPIFQVLFALRNVPSENFSLPGLELKLIPNEQTTAKLDLSLFMAEGPQGLSGRWEYNTDLFDRATVLRMAGHFQTILQSALANPDMPVSELPMLTEAERRQILVEWNATEAEYPRSQCVHQMFEEQAARTPEARAVAFRDQSLTYRQLNERSNQLAHYLQKQGALPGRRVGLYLERSVEMMVALLAVQKTGAAYVPLDPAYPPERIRLTLEDAQVPVMVSSEALIASLPSGSARIVCIDSEWSQIAREKTSNPESEATAEDLIYVIFTSGSTGRPKGVQVPHRAVVNLLTYMGRELQMDGSDVFPALASFAFDMSIPELYLALVTGGCVALGERELAVNGEELARWLREIRATVVHATPTMWRLLLEAGFSGRGLKRAIGAEPVPQELCSRLLEADSSLYNFYGPTETTVWSTVHHFRDPGEPVTVGRPLANTQIYILDRNRQPVPIGVPGEIFIGGDGVTCGYLNRPDLTAEKFVDDPFSTQPGAKLYRTGDLARYLLDGRIEFQGRADNQVKVRGYRIELGEIETVLGAQPQVDTCVVVAREDEPGNRRLVAYVVPADGRTPDFAALRSAVKQRLPEYMVPVAWVAMENLPLSPNGKVDRRALPVPEYGRRDLAEGELEARTPVEEVIAQIWAEVLKLEKVGPEENFFELGGHSLLATQVMSRIRQSLKVDLPLRNIFEAPTVSELARQVDNAQRRREGIAEPPLLPADRGRDVPLSFAQQRLWFLDKLDPQNPAYNISWTMRISGPLNVRALECSLQRIVERHEVLRSRFATSREQPVQIADVAANIELAVQDLASLPQSERETRATELVVEEAHRPFDLGRGPLIRAGLIRIAPDDHVLMVNLHHAIGDRWSLSVLSRELAVFYEAEISHQDAPLRDLPLQYGDFAIWQREWLRGEVLDRQLSYFRQKLAGAPPLLELPTDRPRPAMETFRGSVLIAPLQKEIAEGIKALGRREGTTLFMTLLAVFQTLLARYSGQEDVVVGSPIANRNRTEVENLIGFFANTLVLRTDLSGDPSFRELLGRVRETALGAYAHQDLPFEKLVEELQPERNLSHNPIFQVMFALQNTPAQSLSFGGLALRPMNAKSETAKCDLALFVAENPNGLAGRWEYNTDLFDRATIQRMSGHFEYLLRNLLADPDQKVWKASLLGEEERQELLVDWNDTRSAYPQDVCIHQLIEAQSARTPDSVALVFQDQELTYFELNQRANQLGHYLRKLGVGRGDLVALCVERSLDMVVGLLGILKAGAAYVPVDPAYPRDRVAFMLTDAGVKAVVTQQLLLENLPATETPCICLDRDWAQIEKESRGAPVALASPQDLAYVIYTSGSTGKPKGVQIEHRAVVNFLHSMQREPGLSEQDRLLAVTTLSFDIAGLEMYLPLMSGACIVIASREQTSDGNRLLALMQRSGTTFMQATPATWRMLLEVGWEGDKKLKILCGGEALPPDLAEHLLARCSELWNVYGPTETTIWSAAYRVTSGRVLLGRPIANTQFYVLDRNHEPVPAGVPGELFIGGDGLARGYLHRPELTAERFVPDPFYGSANARMYRTGDLVRWRHDGNLEYLGRMDFQVKVRGFRIELGEIEAVLAKHPAVQQAVVTVREDTPGDKRLVAYIVSSGGEVPATGDLRAHLKSELPDYMVPGAFVTLENLPLTPNGKVDRKALPKPDSSRQGSGQQSVPRDDFEQVLLAAWRKVLGVDEIGIHDNFFELGGHSLLAVRLINEIRKVTGKELPLATLFRGATVEHMARVLREGPEAITHPILMEIEEGNPGRRPRFFAAVRPGGNSLGYAQLARFLGSDQPFYKLQAPRPADRTRPYSAEEFRSLAAEYTDAMQAIQPAGPYYIGGMCEGARISYEMARLLEERGEKVALLAILDTWVVENSQRKFLWQVYYYWQRTTRWLKLGTADKWLMVKASLRNKLGRVTKKHGPVQTAWRQAYWPGKEFVPPTYHGRITLLKVPRQPFYYVRDPMMGWGGWTTGGIEIRTIAARHMLLLRRPYVEDVARQLRNVLDEAHREILAATSHETSGEETTVFTLDAPAQR
jgi:amino acid adenylation domain-containing protein